MIGMHKLLLIDVVVSAHQSRPLYPDQRFVVGVGNIYACEALHKSGISPTRLAAELVTKNGKPTKALERLVDEVKIVLKKAMLQAALH